MPEWAPAHKPVGEHWVGVFVAASARQRCWPVDWTFHLMNALAMEGYTVCPLGGPLDLGMFGYHRKDGEGNHQFSHYLAPPPGRFKPSLGSFKNLPQLADFMRRYLDLVVSPDTIGVHLAGVLKIPCLAIYGSFPAELRMKHYPSVQALQGSADCAPCFSHDRQMSCGAFWCKALAAVTPQQVYEKVKEICPRQQPGRIAKITLSPNAPLSAARLRPAGDRSILSMLR